MRTTLLVIAKAPVPGRVKTRLTPPLAPAEAARLAEAALRDTLETALAAPADRRVLALDGVPGPWLPEGYEVIPQRGDGLAERLDSAFADSAPGPALLVGMDTPQLVPQLLDAGLQALVGGSDAVLGEAPDGGYWAIGLRRYVAGAFDGVPMSAEDTAARQRRRLERLGLSLAELPMLRDFDDFDDALAVAAEAPASAFAAALAEVCVPEAA